MSGPEVVTFGEALAVFFADPGTPLATASTFRRSVAGAELNVAIGLARLGHGVGWFGRVGDDAHGRLVLRTLRGEGVDVSRLTVDPTGPTGILVRDAHAQRVIDVSYFRSGSAGSRLSPEDVDLDYVRGASVLWVSGVTAAISSTGLAAVRYAVDAAREAEVTVVLDPNIRYRLAPLEAQVRALRELSRRVDVVLAGEDEALAITGMKEVRGEADEWFLAQGCKTVVVKAGEAGAWATDGSKIWTQPAFPVQVVDPVGAGDAFGAGFVSGLLAGAALPDALERAAACGALNVSVAGDFEGSPTAVELSRFLEGSDVVNR
jgi:2-dehydro-3-deoxygluconokinase